MTSPFGISNPGESLQREKRCHRVFTDQDGRRFSAVADSTTQQPIGELIPAGWVAPWLPAMRFAKWRQINDLDFRWDYGAMADELAAQTAAYYEQATKFALEHNLPNPEVGGLVDRRIQAVFGHPPLSPEIPLSADAKDPWLLGVAGTLQNDDIVGLLRQGVLTSGNEALTAIKERIAARSAARDSAPVVADADDPVLTPLSPETVTYQSFMAEARKNGMSMADIALAWKAHKDNLALEMAA